MAGQVIGNPVFGRSTIANFEKCSTGILNQMNLLSAILNGPDFPEDKPGFLIYKKYRPQLSAWGDTCYLRWSCDGGCADVPTF